MFATKKGYSFYKVSKSLVLIYLIINIFIYLFTVFIYEWSNKWAQKISKALKHLIDPTFEQQCTLDIFIINRILIKQPVYNNWW